MEELSECRGNENVVENSVQQSSKRRDYTRKRKTVNAIKIASLAANNDTTNNLNIDSSKINLSINTDLEINQSDHGNEVLSPKINRNKSTAIVNNLLSPKINRNKSVNKRLSPKKVPAGRLRKYETFRSRATLLKPQTCDKCHKIFPTENIFIQHLRYHHKVEKPFKCRRCEFTTKLRPSLIAHQYTHDGIKPFKCEHCQAAFRDRTSLRLHQRIHSGEKPYVCSYCGKPFRLHDSLRVHEKIHTNENMFSCEICDRRFRKKHHLNNHVKTHTGEKAYLCPKCGHRSRQLSHHLRHVKSHERKCTCGLKFKSHLALKDHLFLEHGDKSHKLNCVKCDVEFSKPSECVRHKKNGHEFTCTICGLKLGRIGDLKIHRDTQHREKLQQDIATTSGIDHETEDKADSPTADKTQIQEDTIDNDGKTYMNAFQQFAHK